MDAKTIREKFIRPKLTEIFGSVIANALVSKAALAGMKGTNELEKLTMTVECICSDAKVIGMWGMTQSGKQKEEWLKLLQ